MGYITAGTFVGGLDPTSIVEGTRVDAGENYALRSVMAETRMPDGRAMVRSVDREGA
jgi:hypothetical protein